jgi:hypothetical protein
MSTIEMRLAQLQRISGLVLDLAPGDRAAILALLNQGGTPEIAPADVPARKKGRPAGTGRIVKTKKWGLYRIRHKVTNNLVGKMPRIDRRPEGEKYREAMVAKHGQDWVQS